MPSGASSRQSTIRTAFAAKGRMRMESTTKSTPAATLGPKQAAPIGKKTRPAPKPEKPRIVDAANAASAAIQNSGSSRRSKRGTGYS